MNAPASLIGSFQGTAQAFQASLASEPVLVAAAVIVIYIVLRILYESFIHPLTILSTLPSAGLGARCSRCKLSGIDFIPIIAMVGADPADRHREEERHPDGRLRDPGRAHPRGLALCRSDPRSLPLCASGRS